MLFPSNYTSVLTRVQTLALNMHNNKDMVILILLSIFFSYSNSNESIYTGNIYIFGEDHTNNLCIKRFKTIKTKYIDNNEYIIALEGYGGDYKNIKYLENKLSFIANSFYKHLLLYSFSNFSVIKNNTYHIKQIENKINNFFIPDLISSDTTYSQINEQLSSINLFNPDELKNNLKNIILELSGLYQIQFNSEM